MSSKIKRLLHLIREATEKMLHHYKKKGFISICHSIFNSVYMLTVIKFFNTYYTYIFPNIQYCYYTVRFNSDSLDPKKVIYVKPKKINHLVTPRFREYNRTGTYIQGGQWDQRECSHDLMLTSTYREVDELTRCILLFNQYGLYKSSKSHFEDDVPWEQTEICQWMDKKERSGYRSKISRYRSNRFSQMPELYRSISENGYLSQWELQSKTLFKSIKTRLTTPDEVLVNIGRNGEIFLDDGRHRLIIAKILNIDQIPVRVFVRHPEWVQKKLRAEQDRENSSITPHPDIQNR